MKRASAEPGAGGGEPGDEWEMADRPEHSCFRIGITNPQGQVPWGKGLRNAGSGLQTRGGGECCGVSAGILCQHWPAGDPVTTAAGGHHGTGRPSHRTFALGRPGGSEPRPL